MDGRKIINSGIDMNIAPFGVSDDGSVVVYLYVNIIGVSCGLKDVCVGRI
jgi:hypothetical protein